MYRLLFRVLPSIPGSTPPERSVSTSWITSTAVLPATGK